MGDGGSWADACWPGVWACNAARTMALKRIMVGWESGIRGEPLLSPTYTWHASRFHPG
jgi:hypothetical protein